MDINLLLDYIFAFFLYLDIIFQEFDINVENTFEKSKDQFDNKASGGYRIHQFLYKLIIIG